MELSTARRLKVGDTVTLDGVLFKVTRAPFGTASVRDSRIVDEDVTLTLERGPQVDARFANRERDRMLRLAEDVPGFEVVS